MFIIHNSQLWKFISYGFFGYENVKKQQMKIPIGLFKQNPC
jgi:hypothetical protein